MNIWNGQVVAYIDMLLCLVCGLVVMLTPPLKKDDATDKPICQLAVDLSWDATLETDIDLWVRGPRTRPIGYSNKNGPIFDHVRDDVGTMIAGKPDQTNSERICARILPDGQYVVNAHLFDLDGAPLPVEVHLQVIKFEVFDGTSEVWIDKTVNLEGPKQELTIIRFVLQDGKIDQNSINDIPTPLRTQ